MGIPSPDQTLLRVADLPARRAHRFDIRPGPEALAEIAAELGLSDLRKLRFEGELKAEGRSAWRLTARLGATAVQPCVVTLAPVTTRVETDVRRLYTRDWDETVGGDEIEMPEDDTIEPLGPEIDLGAVIAESLALALPDYPRAEGAALENAQFAAPGIAPMRDEDARPFAGLAGLKEKLEKPDGE